MSTANGDGKSSSPLLHLVADRLAAIRDGRLSDEVYDKAVLCLLDYLGALVAGLSAPWTPSLLKYAQSGASGRGEAWAIGVDSLVSAEAAAFNNAAIGHSMIRDDMHVWAASHLGVIVIPGALALAQRENWTGMQLLKAIVGGYEAAVALGTAMRSSGLCNPHFRPSGMIGAFGVAAAGVVADQTMSEETAINALSFGINMAAGLNEWAWAGGTEIYTQMGTASRGGIVSLDLARAGMQSSDTVLEGRDGAFRAYRKDDQGEKVFRDWFANSDLGAGILSIRFKPVAGCNFIQTPLSVAMKLHSRVGDSTAQIDHVHITTTAAAKRYPGCNSFGPFENIGQAKMSIQYGVAAALILGKIDESAYRQHDNAALQDLVRKCTVEDTSDYDQAFSEGKQPCKIEITMEDGMKYEEALADVPWLGPSSVEGRFKQEAAGLYSSEVVSKILNECREIQGAESTSRLFEVLAFTPA